MSVAKIPGFTAESSLQKPITGYRTVSRLSSMPLVTLQENCYCRRSGTETVCNTICPPPPPPLPPVCTEGCSEEVSYCRQWKCDSVPVLKLPYSPGLKIPIYQVP
jgi:hypothetical protein